MLKKSDFVKRVCSVIEVSSSMEVYGVYTYFEKKDYSYSKLVFLDSLITLGINRFKVRDERHLTKSADGRYFDDGFFLFYSLPKAFELAKDLISYDLKDVKELRIYKDIIPSGVRCTIGLTKEKSCEDSDIRETVLITPELIHIGMMVYSFKRNEVIKCTP